ncbi:hypothetical protein [Acholeplasma hippikon]|uniref:Uncharacterized protein n=1 Tax=Acholeplasma hippikon TaxID=264636 RepID=A0A449BJV2_9MOLU|nr:hypothetical protein [Acholeplasma hippikon]VEU82751.1 Uncharacterised protein [Acholeplasma hippikon]
MYISIADKESILNFNLNYEIERLEEYFYKFSLIEKDLSYYFERFPNKKHRSSFRDYYNYVEEIYENSVYDERYLILSDFLINIALFGKFIRDTTGIEKPRINQILLEFERIYYILSKLNFEVKIENSGTYNVTARILHKDQLAEFVASKINNTKVTKNILEFLEYNLSLDRKQDILEELYKYYEGIKNGGNAGQILQTLFNNGLRHEADNKVKCQAIKEYINENREYVINESFKLMIEAFYSEINSPFKKIILDLQR